MPRLLPGFTGDLAFLPLLCGVAVLFKLGVPNFVGILDIGASGRLQLFLDQLSEFFNVLVVSQVGNAKPCIALQTIRQVAQQLDRNATLRIGGVLNERSIGPVLLVGVVCFLKVHEAYAAHAAPHLQELGRQGFMAACSSVTPGMSTWI